jgi:hypothetical protein
MTTTGPNSPDSVTSEDLFGYGFGTTAWADPGNAAASDDNYATISTTGFIDFDELLTAVDYDFAIDGGATIDRFKAEFEGHISGIGATRDIQIYLVYNGQIVGADYGTRTLSGSDTYYEDSNDGWNLGDYGIIGSLTPAIVNDPTFGFALVPYSDTDAIDYFIDHTRGTIEYTASGSWQTKVMKVWNGSSWVTKPVKVWDGGAWVTKPTKVFM